MAVVDYSRQRPWQFFPESPVRSVDLADTLESVLKKNRKSERFRFPLTIIVSIICTGDGVRKQLIRKGCCFATAVSQ